MNKININGAHRVQFHEEVLQFCKENEIVISYLACDSMECRCDILIEVGKIPEFENLIAELESNRRTMFRNNNVGIWKIWEYIKLWRKHK